MSASTLKGFFAAILDKISIKQISSLLIIWIVSYYFLNSYVNAELLPSIPYISDEYKLSITFLIFSIFIVIFGSSISNIFSKLINSLKMKEYINILDVNEQKAIKEFFNDGTNSCSFSPVSEEGICTLIDKGILIPVDKESYRKKRSSFFYFYLHPKAKKYFEKKYLQQ